MKKLSSKALQPFSSLVVLTPSVFAIGFLTVFFAFRLWLARDTSFWSDEMGWMGNAAINLSDLLKRIAEDPSPHLFLDVFLLSSLSRPLLALGVHPHIAVRFYTIVFSLILSWLPFFSRNFTNREKILWLFVTQFSCAVTAMSVNARPYEGLLFFGGVAACLILEVSRLSRNYPTRITGTGQKVQSSSVSLFASFTYSILLSLGLLEHVYIMIPAFFSALFILFSKFGQRQKVKILTPLLISTLVFLWWFLLFKTNKGYYSHSLSFIELVQRFFHEPLSQWVEIGRQTFGVFSNPGKRFIFVLPIAALGWFTLWKKDYRAALIYLVIFVSTLLTIILLNLKYNYFFVPRQVFGAFGVWCWCVVFGIEKCAEHLRSKNGLKNHKNKYRAKHKNTKEILFYAFVTFFIGVLPTLKIIHDEPPYVDQPRYRLEAVVNQITKNGTIGYRNWIVLSQCDELVASLYLVPGAFKNYFGRFLEDRPIAIATSSRVIVWSDDYASCSGVIPQEPSDRLLLDKVKKNPQNFVVLAAHNFRIPSSLKVVECYTHSGKPCER